MNLLDEFIGHPQIYLAKEFIGHIWTLSELQDKLTPDSDFSLFTFFYNSQINNSTVLKNTAVPDIYPASLLECRYSRALMKSVPGRL